MITFIDGPAAGHKLDLQRAPLFLRVVIGLRGEVDALDRLDDEPTAFETIHVYRMTQDLGSGIACSRGKGCRPFCMAEYSYHGVQPSEEEARDRVQWQAWAQAQASALRQGKG